MSDRLVANVTLENGLKMTIKSLVGVLKCESSAPLMLYRSHYILLVKVSIGHLLQIIVCLLYYVCVINIVHCLPTEYKIVRITCPVFVPCGTGSTGERSAGLCALVRSFSDGVST